MFDKIKKIIVEEVGVDESLVTPETRISADLGVDSISFINAAMLPPKVMNWPPVILYSLAPNPKISRGHK